MKNHPIPVLLFLVLGLIPLACQKNYHVDPLPPKNTPTPYLSPTRTPTPTITISYTRTFTPSITFSSTRTFTRTPTPIPTSTPLPNGIVVAGVFDRSIFDLGIAAPVTANAIVVALIVNTLPESTAGVTLTGPGVTVPVPYSGVTVIGGHTYALYQTAASWNYQPGQIYDLTVSTSIGTASGSALAPGDITVAPNGLQTSWAVEGNHDYFMVQQQPSALITYQVSPDVNSPQSIPVTAYSAPTTYSVSTYCMNEVMGLTGAVTGSGLVAMDTYVKMFNFNFTPTPTRTITLTFTPTVTRTFTNTRTATPSPTSTIGNFGPYDYGCSGDTFTGGGSGTRVIGPTKSFVPLCDGWILYGNRATNSVIALNVATGAAAATYTLMAVPGDLAYDVANGYLYCTLDSATFIARINLADGTVTNIPTSDTGDHLCVANGGMVFVVQGEWASQTLTLIDGIGAAVVTTRSAPDVSFPVYNSLTNELFLGVEGTSPSYLYRYSFSSATTTLTSLQVRSDVGSNGQDIAISPDGNHLAFPVGSGNSGYVISDFNPSSINTSYGSWNTGAYPSSAGFSPDSQYIATSNGSDFLVYNVTTHILSKQWADLRSSGFVRTRFSTGGQLVYMMMGDEISTSAPASIFWSSFP
jgi:hypothetical protein